jgi:hypothetical protein
MAKVAWVNTNSAGETISKAWADEIKNSIVMYEGIETAAASAGVTISFDEAFADVDDYAVTAQWQEDVASDGGDLYFDKAVDGVTIYNSGTSTTHKFYYCVKALVGMLILAMLSCAAYADLEGSLRMEIDSEYRNDSVTARVNTVFVGDYRTGGTQGAIDTHYYATRTLASGAAETLGLVGSLTNSVGQVVTFASVRGLAMQNTTATCTLTVGAGTLGIGTFTLMPYGAASFVGSFPVGAGADRLTVTNSSGATATYRIWIVGVE